MHLASHKNFLNRELTWLKFNQRVLQEAIDNSNPLLEKLKFIAISASNLDEFFMIRVAGIKNLIENNSKKRDIANMTPDEQFAAISEATHKQVKIQYSYLRKTIKDLEKEGVHFIKPKDLKYHQQKWLDYYFEKEIYPVITPLAVDASHPFPFLTNRSLNLAVLLETELDEELKTAIIPIPTVLKRIIEVPMLYEDRRMFLYLEDIIEFYAKRFFVGNKILETTTFSITRNADFEIDEEDIEDLLEELEKSLRDRRRGAAVRVDISNNTSKVLTDFITETLGVDDIDIYKIEGPLDYRMYFSFVENSGLDRLKYYEVKPVMPEFSFDEENDIWSKIKDKDLLIHHPYESFEAVTDFILEAAQDKKVLAIKQTLYRVSSDSPIIQALMKAAENGKQVTVLIEVKARFDEENNIMMAKRLEKAGCHVIYGLVGLKTHSKIILVIRREEMGIVRYVHVSTGNYNANTAKLYTDIGMFTANEAIGVDASGFFNLLSGYSDPPNWNKLTVAPINLREKLVSLIDAEIEAVKKGEEGHIIAKMNSLLDKALIVKLYEASNAGVKVELIIRGICVLIPGLEGISENITVKSIIGRLLEHSRVFYFRNSGAEKIYISSADWMPRNLDSRIELMIPVEEEDHKERLKDILNIYLTDNQKSYSMCSDGHYRKIVKKTDKHNAQNYLLELAQEVLERQDKNLFKRRL